MQLIWIIVADAAVAALAVMLLPALQAVQLASWLIISRAGEQAGRSGCVKEQEHCTGATPRRRLPSLLQPAAAGGQAHAFLQPQDAMLAADASQQATPWGLTRAGALADPSAWLSRVCE